MSEEESQTPLLGGRERVLSAFEGEQLRWWPSPSSPDSEIQRSRFQMKRFLTSRAGHYAVLTLVVLDVSCIFADFIITIFTCQKRNPASGWNTTLDALGIVSLVFSCLFMVELLGSIWAFGPSYFKSKFHCFDALVILAGFVIDVLLRGVIEEVASLVVILRLWRVVKIIEELSVGAEEQMDSLRERIELLEHENAHLMEELKQLKSKKTDSQSHTGSVR